MEEKEKVENKEHKKTNSHDREKSRGRSNYRSRRKSYKKKFFYKKKFCFFCKNPDVEIDYKNLGLLRRFTIDSGKISPRRFTGTCAKHQRKISNEIKKARQMALIKYTDKHQ